MAKAYRPNSVLGTGRRRPMAYERITMWRKTCNRALRAGQLSRRAWVIAQQLANRLKPDGWLAPTQRGIAAGSPYQIGSVKLALAELRTLGLVDWENRWIAGDDGRRQTSNAYRLIGEMAENCPVKPEVKNWRRTGLQDLHCGRILTTAERKTATEAWKTASDPLTAALNRLGASMRAAE